MRLGSILLLAVVLAACDSAPAIPTTVPPDIPTTTTTIVNDTCNRLAQDTADYLETVFVVLDQTTLDEARDRAAWPEAMFALEQQGKDLDARSEAMRCDRALIQEAAFLLADIDPDSGLGRYLLELMGRP